MKLENLIIDAFPEEMQPTLAQPSPWLAIRRSLEGQQLVRTTPEPALGGMHRLVSAHLRNGEHLVALRTYLTSRAERLSSRVDAAWEPGAVAHAALSLGLDAPLRLAIGNAMRRLGAYVVDGSVHQLGQEALLHFREQADTQPGNLQALRDLTISLGRVALAANDHETPRLLNEAATVSVRLADDLSGFADAQTDAVWFLQTLLKVTPTDAPRAVAVDLARILQRLATLRGLMPDEQHALSMAEALTTDEAQERPLDNPQETRE